MGFPEMVQAMQERLHTSGSVKNVYGEAISSGGRTIVPVARIGYGFGAGRHGREEEGRGGAGGVWVRGRPACSRSARPARGSFPPMRDAS